MENYRHLFSLCGDNSFGPAVQSSSCRGGFDFTVLFEETVLSILPAACFLILAPLRAARLRRSRVKVNPTYLHNVKLGAIAIYACLQLAMVVLWSEDSYPKTQSSIASAVLNLAVALALALLSHLEHKRSIRPSFLITFYLFASLFFDIARARTQWLLGPNDAPAAILTSSVVFKFLILAFEAAEKRRILLTVYKNLSPENTSSIFSRGVFWWLNSLLLKGYKSVLSVDDLLTINENLAAKQLTDDLQAMWNKSQRQSKKHALALETMILLRWEALAILVPRFCLVALNISQPFLIGSAIHFIESPSDKESDNIGYGLIGAFGFVYIGTAVTTGWYQHLSFRLMAQIRSGLIGIIYQKMLTLKSANANDSAAVTLMGTDVENIAENWYILVSELWANLTQLGIAIWLLERQLGAVCIAPVVVALVATSLSMKASTFVTSRQKIWLEAIQDRINFTSEILGLMANIKMLGLTGKMTTLIQGMRVRELNLSKRFRRLSSFNVSLVNLPAIFSQFFTFAIFAIVAKLQGNSSLSISLAITSLSILSLLSNPLAMILYAIPRGYAALGSFKRIQDFLLQESLREERLLAPGSSTTDYGGSPDQDSHQPLHMASIELLPRSTGQGAAVLQNAVFQNVPGTERILHIQRGSFGWSEVNAAVVNEIEMLISRGTQLTMLVGPVGCGKSTLLKAILGETSTSNGEVFLKHPEVAFCDQTPWILNSSIRKNIIGESTFDSNWYESVVRACALDTDLQQMPNCDETILGSKGVILSGGQKQRVTIARAVYARKKLAIFDDVFSGLDIITEELVFNRVFGQEGLLRKTATTVILATHVVNRLSDADHVIVMGGNGRIVEQNSFAELSNSGDYIQRLRKLKNEHKSVDSIEVIDSKQSPFSKMLQKSAAPIEDKRRTGDWTVYKYYTASLGWMSLSLFVLFVSSNSLFGVLQQVWLNWWSQSDSSQQLGYWLGIYSVFAILKGTFLVMAVFYVYVHIVPKSAKSLHWSVLKAAMSAPLSFFVSTETGVLVNRFSQDMRLVDMTLPAALTEMCFNLANCIGVTCLVVVAVGYFAIAVPFILGILYCVQSFYLRTSRQLRLLELETKAPIYAHFIESLQGLVTIRAFGWQEAFKEKNLRLIDISQKPFYLLLCIQRWLTLVLDLIVAGMAILLISLAVALRSKVNAGLLGLALVNMMDVAQTLAQLIRAWTLLETSLGAIARIKEFSEDTPSESLPGEDVLPPSEWPAEGSLKFEGLSATYKLNSPPVLNDINLSISSGQKVGICGRTGSGKSSLLLSVLRMVEPTSGRITIDNQDLSTIPRSTIRQKLICLTQQPFLFTGSIRLNADPLGEVTDSEIAAALQKVSLWDVVLRKVGTDSSEIEAILDANMDENFLSHGQRQLFCLARALLKRGSILLLDEPTSSVDIKTDAQMQAIIHSEFKHHTIIMIAHRLDSLLDFDRVAVLDKGRLVEYGEPRALLKKEEGAFSKLYHG